LAICRKENLLFAAAHFMNSSLDGENALGSPVVQCWAVPVTAPPELLIEYFLPMQTHDLKPESAHEGDIGNNVIVAGKHGLAVRVDHLWLRRDLLVAAISFPSSSCEFAEPPSASAEANSVSTGLHFIVNFVHARPQ
jgi:hypothetical protein